MQEQSIKSRLDELPEDLKKEALDYIEFLVLKYHITVTSKKRKVLVQLGGWLTGIKRSLFFSGTSA